MVFRVGCIIQQYFDNSIIVQKPSQIRQMNIADYWSEMVS